MASKPLQMTAEKWVLSKRLEDAIPKLKNFFQYSANEDGRYPLFSKYMHDHVWRTFPINRDREAAILVPIVVYEGLVSLLFTKRSRNMRTYLYEVSYPGGHFHSDVDNSLEDTAVREAKEELNGDYPWEDVEIIGKTTVIPSLTGTPITPVLAVLPYHISSDTFMGNPDEVEEVFYVNVEELIQIETAELNKKLMTNIPVYPAAEDKRIWGLTAMVTRPILHEVLKPIFL